MRTFVILLALSCGVLRAGGGDTDPYRGAARRYAAALLEHGRDHYGRVKTPLFVHMIDLRTLEVPRQRTPAEWRSEMAGWKEDRNYLMWGKDRSSVLWAQDSNLLWDTENVRLFYALSKESGDPRFAQAADEYLKFFLAHCISRTTGLFAWGEHIAYNVVDDEIHGKRHELQHVAPLWEELWRFSPDAVRNEIEGVYRYHITDKRSMAYDRHANFWNGMPERDQATILGYAGTFAEAFEFLALKTGETGYREWARRLMLAFQSKSNDAGLYPDNWTDRQARDMPLQFPARPTMALSLYRLYEQTGDARWLDDANRYLDGCRRELEAGRVDMADANAWNPLIQAATLGYRMTGSAERLDLARTAARRLLARPQPKAQMASMLAASMHSLRSLYEATGEPEWLAGARRLGDYALAVFVHPSGLIRGTAVVDRPDYYDAIQGPGMLALELWELGGVKAGTEVRRRSGDTAAPEIDGWSFPALASNAKAVAVKVRIADPSGVKRCALHYAYGNEVGFVDERPEVSGQFYTFHIAPPGLAFVGEVSFAVEAVDGSANANRTMSSWRRLKLASEERPRVAGGEARYPALGLTVAGSGAGLARLTRWLPAGTEALPKGLVAAGRSIEFETAPLGRITLDYAPEEAWRLIEPTLALAYWDGKSWVRTPGEVDAGRHRVSTEARGARIWTLVGEDRVLWRAPGRETGAAVADLNGQGTYQVVTTVWLPGELLSEKGESVARYEIDPPYHPVLNSSAPAVAVLEPGSEPVLLFGAPAGYVYAYTKSGRRLWRTEVGGEILGAVAVGRLTDAMGIAVAWNGGVAVLDAKGRKLWEKTLPQPSGQTPVLVDLDGDGRLEIVLNTGSRLVALEGGTGRELWSFDSGGNALIVPAAGEFTRGAAPSLITGDESGVVYAVDATGRLLWRQTRIFGPREVPEPVDYYAGIAEIGLADLTGQGERQVIVATRAGETVALGARGQRLWRFASYERKVGISYGGGARLAFADLDGDGRLEVVLSEQDSYLYVLDAAGRMKWCYLGYFWYHTAPVVADLQHTGELNILFTAPEENGTYALRSGFKGKPGQAPWPMTRGGLARTNTAPW